MRCKKSCPIDPRYILKKKESGYVKNDFNTSRVSIDIVFMSHYRWSPITFYL
jgi:hypothetical protein